MSSSSAVVTEDNVPTTGLFGAVRWPLEVNMITNAGGTRKELVPKSGPPDSTAVLW